MAVLHLYRGKVAKDSREVGGAGPRHWNEAGNPSARGLQAFAGLDPANPYQPSSKATALTQSVWAGVSC